MKPHFSAITLGVRDLERAEQLASFSTAWCPTKRVSLEGASGPGGTNDAELSLRRVIACPGPVGGDARPVRATR